MSTALSHPGIPSNIEPDLRDLLYREWGASLQLGVASFRVVAYPYFHERAAITCHEIEVSRKAIPVAEVFDAFGAPLGLCLVAVIVGRLLKDSVLPTDYLQPLVRPCVHGKAVVVRISMDGITPIHEFIVSEEGLLSAACWTVSALHVSGGRAKKVSVLSARNGDSGARPRYFSIPICVSAGVDAQHLAYDDIPTMGN